MRRLPKTPVMCGSHNVEVFGLPRRLRPDFCVSAPDWWEVTEPSRVLLVPTRTIFAYYTNLIRGKYPVGNLVWRIATNEVAVTSLVAFLATMRDGVLATRTLDPRMVSSSFGVLVPLPVEFRRIIESLGFFRVVAETGYSTRAEYILYQQSIKVYRLVVDLLEPFFLYGFASGKVYALPAEMVDGGINRNAAGERTSKQYVPTVSLAYVSNQRATFDDAKSAYAQYHGPPYVGDGDNDDP